MSKNYIILILLIIGFLIIFYQVSSKELFRNVLEPNTYDNLYNYFNANFKSDNLKLNNFFSFKKCGTYFPLSRNIVNKYYSVPLTI